MRVRRFRPADAKQCSNIIIKNLSTVNRKEDPKKTNKRLIEDNQPCKILANSKKRKYFVAVDKGKLVGIGGYKDNELHSFFVEPSIHSKGIGKAIMTRTLKEAKNEGIRVMKCYSSLYAEKFYASCGFRRLKKKKLPFHGSKITFIDMRKTL